MAKSYVQFSFNVRCEYLHDVCFISGEFVREIFAHLDTTQDEILIRYKGIGIVFSKKLEHSKN